MNTAQPFKITFTANSTAHVYSSPLFLRSTGATLVNFEVTNGAGQAITHFKVQGVDYAPQNNTTNGIGTFYDYLADSDFNSTSNANMRFSNFSTTSNLIAAAGTANAHIVANAAAAIRFSAEVASGNGTITVQGNMVPIGGL